jgi:hypothetical protein
MSVEDLGLTVLDLASLSVDISNDIQSCGGCWSDGTGEDCTLLLSEDDAGEVACVKGVCNGQCSLQAVTCKRRS